MFQNGYLAGTWNNKLPNNDLVRFTNPSALELKYLRKKKDSVDYLASDKQVCFVSTTCHVWNDI